MILHFVRHGQTDFNKKHLLQGKQFDEPLNEEGLQQVRDILPNLPHDFEVIYSSPLKRVLASAEIIKARFDKPIIITDQISERDFGSLAGKTWDDIPNGRKMQEIDRELKYDYKPYGGESVQDVTDRLNKFLDNVKGSGHKVALVVSSIGILRLVYKLLLNKDIVEINNASVHTFEI